MDRFAAMSLFITVVEEGGFSAASKKLKIPLPTVSRNIKQLEAHLNAKLLIRTTRKLMLTDVGQKYLDSARRILEQVQWAENEVTGDRIAARGIITMTAPVMFGHRYVMPILSRFLALHPEIDIHCHLNDRNTDLIDNGIDVAIRIGHLPDSGLIAKSLGMMRLVHCISPKLLSKDHPIRTPQDLKHYPGIQIALPMTPYFGLTRRDQSKFMLSDWTQTRLVVSTPEAAVSAAIEGTGVTSVFHYQAYDALCQGKLILILSHYESPPLPIHLLFNEKSLLPHRVRLFIDFLQKELSERIRVIGATTSFE
ncbi:hypothetical protein ATY35_16965 [Vibrio cidicii]|uniref:HTH lysR-type domain-containing protein n=1 Tax=Vibrio cidicii TaxID=1763883 RepID=A0ABR5W2W7_9VIBR|nr:LysR family transcriptional regulator [Vibrio cidicii]KYN85059.1 hypothetical protein ATY35_16965 [Vibrio cidicii]MBG0761671.1 hypothetical protein [Vibrio cidicii]HDB1447935.1 LysR family transcriptional regulator [Vibrio cholerae]